MKHPGVMVAFLNLMSEGAGSIPAGANTFFLPTNIIRCADWRVSLKKFLRSDREYLDLKIATLFLKIEYNLKESI